MNEDKIGKKKEGRLTRIASGAVVLGIRFLPTVLVIRINFHCAAHGGSILVIFLVIDIIVGVNDIYLLVFLPRDGLGGLGRNGQGVVEIVIATTAAEGRL